MCVEALRVALAAGETFVAFCVAVFVAACAGACRTCRKRRGPLVAASITFEEAAEAARTGDVLIFTSDPRRRFFAPRGLAGRQQGQVVAALAFAMR